MKLFYKIMKKYLLKEEYLLQCLYKQEEDL